MPSSEATAARWTEFIAARPEFPVGRNLLAAFRAGTISSLCDCGCHAFELHVPEDLPSLRIAHPGDVGSVFELSFEVTAGGPPGGKGSLELAVFADRRGHFAGMDVDFCANSYPVPEKMVLAERPYHVHSSPAFDTNPLLERTFSSLARETAKGVVALRRPSRLRTAQLKP